MTVEEYGCPAPSLTKEVKHDLCTNALEFGKEASFDGTPISLRGDVGTILIDFPNLAKIGRKAMGQVLRLLWGRTVMFGAQQIVQAVVNVRNYRDGPY